MDQRAVRQRWMLIPAIIGVLLVGGSLKGSATANSHRVLPVGITPPVQGLDRKFENRIINGVDVSYPWQAALGAGGGSFFEDQRCGGTLISSDLVLTAAHCVLTDQKGLDPDIAAYGLRVLVGSSTLSGSGGDLREATKIWTWTNSYNPKTAAWDIALLELSSPTTSGMPIKIAGPDERPLWSEGRPVWASGWGSMGGGNYPDHLKGTWMTVVGNAPCRASWGGNLEWQTQFCAGSPPNGGYGTCSGDSGGPLVGGSSTGTPRLVGVTSFGWEKRCASSAPDGFAKVAAEPLMTSIQSFVSQIRPGISVVGSGEVSPLPLDRADAWANAGIFVRWGCDLSWLCRRVSVRSCWQTSGNSYTCSVSQYLRRGWRKVTATRRVAVTDHGSTISREGLGRWRLSWGWR